MTARRWLMAVVVAGMLSARAAEPYQVDPAHTTIGFSVTHLVISEVKGRFNEFAGVAEFDGDKLKAMHGTIQVKSIDTGNAKRDEHLRNQDFFDVAKHPTISFELKRVRQDDRGTVVTGALTMHGVTKDVSGPVTVKGPVKDPWGNQRVGLQTKFTLDRREFGLTWNKALETGGVMVGDKVTIEISAEAVKQAPPPVK